MDTDSCASMPSVRWMTWAVGPRSARSRRRRTPPRWPAARPPEHLRNSIGENEADSNAGALRNVLGIAHNGLVTPLRQGADRGVFEHAGGAGGVDGDVFHRAAFGDGEIQFDPTLDLAQVRLRRIDRLHRLDEGKVAGGDDVCQELLPGGGGVQIVKYRPQFGRSKADRGGFTQPAPRPFGRFQPQGKARLGHEAGAKLPPPPR